MAQPRTIVLAMLAGIAIASAPPNIIFILADDMGRSDLHAIYDNTNQNGIDVQAPHLTQLASQGMVFKQAYSGPVCAPSRAMFVTGRYNGNTTIRGNDGAFTPFQDADRNNNIPWTLRQAGYTSALHGKWGLGDYGTTGFPTNQSWDQFMGYDSQVECHNWYPDELYQGDGPIHIAANTDVCEQFSEDMFINTTLSFLENHANSSHPFFLFLSYVTPHAGDCSHEGNSHVQPGPYAVPDIEAPYKSKQWEDMYKDYASAITRQDRDTGKVMAALETLGLADNTVVLFASDNGPEEQVYPFFNSTGGLRGYKRSLYEGGIRAPLIVRWPGTVPPNTSSSAVVSFTDMLPTFAEIAGLGQGALPHGTQGTSFLNALKGEAVAQRPPLYWEFCQRQGRFSYGNGWGQALRDGDLKLIRINWNYTASEQTGVHLELYDVVTDPRETTDLSKDGQYAVQIKAMQQAMDSLHIEDVYWPSGPDCCDHQYGPQGPCTPSNPPYPPATPLRPHLVPPGWQD